MVLVGASALAASATGLLCLLHGDLAHSIWAVIAFVAVSCLPCVAVGGWMLWHIVTDPLRNLVVEADRAAAGNFIGPLGAGRNDEIGRLGQAIEAMGAAVALSAEEQGSAGNQIEEQTARRIEELELANRRLREELSQKDYFLRAVSHDLNAPLRNISGMAAMALLKHGDVLTPEVAARLKRIQANADMAGEMICELLELSRIQSAPQKRRVVDMAELIAEQAKVFDFELSNRSISLEVKGPMPVLYVDKALVRKAFQNLIDNAIKYMDKLDGGRIEVDYQRIGDLHRFCVSDNGPGVPSGEQESIFRPFRRASGAGTTRVAGKGLGLATVATVAEEYSGRAWVESVPGAGARFYMTFAADKTLSPGQVSVVHGAASAVDKAPGSSGSTKPSGHWRTA